MNNQTIEVAKPTIYGAYLAQIFENNPNMTLRDKFCASLKRAYDMTPAFVPIVIADRSKEEPPQPPETVLVPNPYRVEILTEAIKWGCDWAKKITIEWEPKPIP